MAAVLETQADGACKELRLVAGAVGEIPQEITAAEEQARGAQLSGKLIDDIAQAYADAIEPLSDLRGSAWYRKQIIRVLARRAMEQVSAPNESETLRS